jgi:hypothetical protein
VPPTSLLERLARDGAVQFSQGRILQQPGRILVEVYPGHWIGVLVLCFFGAMLLWAEGRWLFAPTSRGGSVLLGLPISLLGLAIIGGGLHSGLTRREFIALTDEGQIELRTRTWGVPEQNRRTPRRPEACVVDHSRAKNNVGYQVQIRFEKEQVSVLKLSRKEDAQELCWLLTSATLSPGASPPSSSER